MSEKSVDITIVGGGFVGLSLVLALKSTLATSISLRLLESPVPPREPDGRAFALGQGAYKMLKTLGVVANIEKKLHPIQKMEILSHGLDDLARLPLLTFEEGGDPDLPLAFMVESQDLLEALESQLACLDFQRQHVPPDLDLTNSAGKVSLGGGEGSRLIVAADGASSAIRQKAGIKVVHWDYGQHGIVAKVRHEKPHHHVALQSFLPNGPFARLPLAEHQSSFVWSETSQEAERLLALSESEFLEALRQRFGNELGEVELQSKPVSWPLALMLSREYGRERLVLVGDAAHKVHPLAGQGLNLGLRDVAALTEVIADQIRLGLDPGAEEVIERYTQWRRFDNVTNALAMDSLNRLHRTQNPLIRFAREMGLGMVDRSVGTKSFLGKAASGFLGQPPKLLLGELA